MFTVSASLCSLRSSAQRGAIAGETFPEQRRLKSGTKIRREQQRVCRARGRCMGKREDFWGFPAGNILSILLAGYFHVLPNDCFM